LLLIIVGIISLELNITSLVLNQDDTQHFY